MLKTQTKSTWYLQNIPVLPLYQLIKWCQELSCENKDVPQVIADNVVLARTFTILCLLLENHGRRN